MFSHFRDSISGQHADDFHILCICKRRSHILWHWFSQWSRRDTTISKCEIRYNQRVFGDLVVTCKFIWLIVFFHGRSLVDLGMHSLYFVWNINKNHLHNGNIRALFGKAEGWFTFSTTALIAQTLEWYVQKYFEQSFKRTSMSDSLIACELNWYGQTGCTVLCEMKGMKDELKFYCTDKSVVAKSKTQQTQRIIQVKLNFNIL